MLDISKFVTVDENGKVQIDSDAYKSAYDADLRKSLDTNSENTRKKLEKEIREQLTEEAKLSAEEKLKKDREDFEVDMTNRLKAFAQKQAEIKMKNANFDDDEISTYLELVNDDESLSKIDKIIASRAKKTEELKKQWQSEISQNQPNPTSNAGDGGETESLGKRMAMKYQNGSSSDNTVTAWGTTNKK